MARSQYIYLVYIDNEDRPTAVFTVKHEAITYIKRTFPLCTGSVTLYRMPDGRSEDMQRIAFAIE